MKTLKLITSLLCLTMLTSASLAEETTGVDLKLLSELTTIQAGKPFTVGLHIHHHKDFHTYWRNPGIVGVPTNITWSLPKGFAAGPIQWPAPEVVDMAGHPAHGFHDDVLLMVTITPPTSLPDKEVTLNAEINWMACANTCHPGFTTRTLQLKTGKQSPASNETVSLFKTAREKLPRPTKIWKASLSTPSDNQSIKLLLTSLSSPPLTVDQLYFFSHDGQVSSDQPQTLERLAPGKYALTLQRSEFGPKNSTSLPGLLASPSPLGKDKQRHVVINPDYPDK